MYAKLTDEGNLSHEKSMKVKVTNNAAFWVMMHGMLMDKYKEIQALKE